MLQMVLPLILKLSLFRDRLLTFIPLFMPFW